MKKIVSSVAAVLLVSSALAQSGMTQDGLPGSGYSRLNRTTHPLGKGYERALGVYQSTINPSSYLEVNSTPGYLTFPHPSIALGEVFRTNSPTDGTWRLMVNSNQVGSISSTGIGADFNLTATPGNMLFKTTAGSLERMRIRGTDGYIGINNTNPLFHMDMITTAFAGGELHYTCKPSDVPKSDLGFCNGAGGANTFLPIMFGKVDASQTGPGLQTVGNVDGTQDNIANNNSWAVTRFVSSRDWVFNSVGLQPLKSRNLFSWSNASFVDMIMNVDGRLRIMNNLNPPVNLPGNRLEVTCSPGDPYFPVAAINGASGLMLTLMPSTVTPVANPGQGVLGVDNAGNVIYVKQSSSSGCCIGNPCTGSGTSPNPLVQNWEVPMSGGGGNWNYMFNEATAGGICQVGIGHVQGSTCGNTFGKLEVINNTVLTTGYRFAGAFINNGSATGINTIGAGGLAKSTLDDAYGVHGNATGAASGFAAIGVVGTSQIASTADLNIGVRGEAANGVKLTVGGDFTVTASNSFTNYGVRTSVNGGNNASSLNWGVFGDVSSNAVVNVGTSMHVANGTSYNSGSDISVSGTTASNNYGVNMSVFGGGGSGSNYGIFSNVFDNTTGLNYGGYFVANGSTTNNYGIYAEALPTTTLTTSPYGPNYAGFFNGDVATTSAYYTISDKTLKKDVKGINSSLEIIRKLNPVNYLFDTDKHKDMGLSHGKQWGFISQEVKEVLPELTAPIVVPALKDKDGKETRAKQEYLGLNYNGFIAILAKGMQEQQSMIEQQQKQIEELKALVLAQNNAPASSNDNKQAVELSDKNIVVLNQNVPNPFAETTVISYNIPDNFTAAQVLFYDNNGKLIKTVDVKSKGKGTLNVFANDLSSGTYSYSLVVDGKIIDTKRMIKQ